MKRLTLYATACAFLAALYWAIWQAEAQAVADPSYQCEGPHSVLLIAPDYMAQTGE